MAPQTSVAPRLDGGADHQDSLPRPCTIPAGGVCWEEEQRGGERLLLPLASLGTRWQIQCSPEAGSLRPLLARLMVSPHPRPLPQPPLPLLMSPSPCRQHRLLNDPDHTTIFWPHINAFIPPPLLTPDCHRRIKKQPAAGNTLVTCSRSFFARIITKNRGTITINILLQYLMS